MLGFQKCKRGWVTAVIVFASAALPAGVTLAKSPVNSALVTSASAGGAKPVVVPTNERLPAVIISIRSDPLIRKNSIPFPGVSSSQSTTRVVWTK
jgi:hypothetical protein